MKLQELFDYFDKQEVNIADYIKTQYNKFSTVLGTEMTDNESIGLYYVITNRLAKLMNCYTIYDDEEDGVTAIQTILKHNIINLTVEIRNMLKVVVTDIATNHAQTKFNPIDNDSIDKAPISMDNLSFAYGENLIAQCDYLMENSKTLGELYSEFANMCYLTNYKSKQTSSGTSSSYATKSALAQETSERIAADTTLEDYCDSLDATKAPAVEYITLTGTSGTLSEEEAATLLSGSPSLNYINKDNMIFHCVYYSEGNKAVYAIAGEQKLHVITITITSGEWSLVTYSLVDESVIEKVTKSIESIIDGTTSFTGDITIEKATPELKLNATSENDLSGVSFLENGTEKRNLLYDNSEGNDKLYFTDGTNELVVPKKSGTIATTDDISVDTFVTIADNQTITGTKNFTATPTINSVNIATTSDVEDVITTIIDKIYPVGSIYTSITDVDPATILGVGTWESLNACYIPNTQGVWGTIPSLNIVGNDYGLLLTKYTNAGADCCAFSVNNAFYAKNVGAKGVTKGTNITTQGQWNEYACGIPNENQLNYMGSLEYSGMVTKAISTTTNFYIGSTTQVYMYKRTA